MTKRKLLRTIDLSFEIERDMEKRIFLSSVQPNSMSADNCKLENLINEYGLIFIDGKRYYKFDMSTDLPSLENTTPYLFKYQNIEICENSWGKMTLEIVKALDKIHPKDRYYLLELEYPWSKTEVFAPRRRTNFAPYKNIFLNTNHTSTHSMMSIQFLLEAFDVNPSECSFIIRRLPAAEPVPIREYLRNKIIKEFTSCMVFRGFSEKRINTTINNFKVINRLLKCVSSGYDDFFLFEDYLTFYNYKLSVINYSEKSFFEKQSYVKATRRALDRLDDFYKNKEFYNKITKIDFGLNFRETLKDEINYLFDSLNTKVITCGKLYSRMAIVHGDLLNKLGEYNNSSGLYKMVKAFFGEDYFCKNPFISADKDVQLNNEEIIKSFIYENEEITISKINDYVSKMHLKNASNYIQLFDDISDDYVQVNQDKIVKKDVLALKSDYLDLIKKVLSFDINSFGDIRGDFFADYDSLPNVGFTWNKYLLLGIVRSYLQNTFQICYSEGTYKTFDFCLKLVAKK